MNVDAFTNTNSDKPPEISLEALTKVSEELQASFLKKFIGVPVIEDVNLPPGRWCCVVAPDIYEELKKIGVVK